ncbi:MAG: hypothetical protein P9L88_01265 [Candidatus Tantalella remota]|nr:hypothetical protein [Candidatus Tantalella remota]
MRKVFIISFIVLFSISFVLPAGAQSKYSYIDIIKSGLLGAGAGALGGAASGAKGSDVWKGALAGAGVNIIGGALLDSITRQNTNTYTQGYSSPQPQVYVQAPQPRYTQQQAVYAQPQPVYAQQPSYDTPRSQYELGFEAGYFKGYKEGYAQALRDAE